MDHAQFKDAAETVAQVVDAAGITVIVVGLLWATATYFMALRGRGDGHREDPYKGYRRGIGKAILLSLEFLVAADIIRTVAVAPTFEGVGVLALIVLVRTFLSFTLELEVSGRWPWQPANDGPEAAPAVTGP